MPIYKVKGKRDNLQKYRVIVNYTDRDGKYKQIERTAYGMEEAKNAERRLALEVKERDITASKMTFQDLYDEFLRVKATELRASSLDVHIRRATNYILPHFKTSRLSAITPAALQKWKLAIEEHEGKRGKLSLYTKKGLYATFAAILSYAVTMQYITVNPLTALGQFKNPNEHQAEMDFYTPDEFLKFIKAAESIAERSELYEWNYYVFFCIAFYCGLRKGEISALKWSDVYDNTIHVRRSLRQDLNGEDVETSPKNKNSIRDVQMPKPLIKVLNDHKNRLKGIDGFSDDWRICGNARNSTLSNRNNQYAAAAGIKSIRIHDFRHSHASLLIMNGINIMEVARRLGHSSTEMTWKVYAHLYPTEEERALTVLNTINL